MRMCPEISFVEPIFEEFLYEKKSKEKFVIVFYLSGAVSPLKPLGLEGGIHMCGDHLLEFCEEGGEITINLQHKIMLCKKTMIKYKKYYRNIKSKIIIQRQDRHLMEEVIAIVLVDDKNELPRSNVFIKCFSKFRDQMLLKMFRGICHSVPNLKNRYEGLGSSLSVRPYGGIYQVG